MRGRNPNYKGLEMTMSDGRIAKHRSALTLLSAFTIVGALSAPLAAGFAAAQSAPLSCANEPFASQEVAPAILSECQVEQFPLVSTSTLSDGGIGYNYDVNGTTMQYEVPPASFDPLTATASELAIYGMQRPADGSALSVWNATHANLNWAKPDPFQVIYTAGVNFSNNWSGYVSTYGGFFTNDAIWTQPSITGTCTNAVEGTWAGIGDGSSPNSQLVQDGVVKTNRSSYGNLTNNEAFWVIVPQYSVAQPTNPTMFVPTGDQAQASVQNLGSGTWRFIIEDDTNGTIRDFTKTATGSVNIGQAEGILEWPNSNYNFPDFGSVTLQVEANYTPLGSLPPLTKETAQGLTGHNLTRESSLSGTTFTDTWNGYCN